MLRVARARRDLRMFQHAHESTITVADERALSMIAARYTPRMSSAVDDGVRKHSPCPLIATAGAQRRPGVQVRLVAGSPTASKCSHLNHGFKVVSHASPWRRTFLFGDPEGFSRAP